MTTETNELAEPEQQQQTLITEGQPAESSPQQPSSGEPTAKPQAEEVLETYEIRAPKGHDVDDAVLSAYSEASKEIGLPQDVAQKMLDKLAPILEAHQSEQIAAISIEWMDKSRADKEFGGDKLTENLAVAKKALDAFGTPELTKLLNETGLGNNPEIIRAFFRAGKTISEDTFVGGKPAAYATDDARSLYPNTKFS